MRLSDMLLDQTVGRERSLSKNFFNFRTQQGPITQGLHLPVFLRETLTFDTSEGKILVPEALVDITQIM